MADNTTLNTGTGGNTIRTLEDGSSIQWPVGVVAYATTVGTPDVLSIPTAAALADNTANPTTLLSGACALWYDGTTWDLARGDSTNGLLVNLGANNDVVCTNAGTFAVQAAVSGDVAHDTADSGAPVKLGAKASTGLHGLTLVADADRTNLFAGIDGALITRPYCGLESIVTGNASNTDGTSTECVAAGAAGIKHYLTTIILTNTSASNIYVEIKDGTTVKMTIPLPANGGAVVNLPVPIPGTAATAWNFDPSAATSTVYCSMIAFKSKV